MKQPSKHKIDKRFQEHFTDMEISMTEPDELWNRIDTKARRKRLLPFLFRGITGSFFIIIGLYYLSNYKSDESIQAFSEYKVALPEQREPTTKDYYTSSNKETTKQESANAASLVLAKQKKATEIKEKNDKAALGKENKLLLKQNKLIRLTSPSSNLLNFSQHTTKFTKANKKTKNEFQEKQPTSMVSTLRDIPPSIIYNSSVSAIPTKSFLTAKLVDEEIIQPSKKNHARLVLNISTGISLPFDKFNNSTQTNGLPDQHEEIYKALWLQHIKPLSSFNIRSTFGYDIGEKWFVYAGLEYHRTEFQFEKTEMVSNRILAYNSKAHFILKTTENIWLGGEVYAQESSLETTYSKILEQRFNIPIGLSYLLYDRSRFSISGQSYAIVNFTRIYKGQFLNNKLLLEELSTSNQNQHIQKTTGLSYELGLSFTYKLRPTMKIFILPNYRNSSVDYFSNDEKIVLRRKSYGAELGLTLGL